MRIIDCSQKSSPFLFRAFIEKPYLCIMYTEITLRQMALLLKKRPEDAHKGTMGHAWLMAGSKGIGGCAVLSAEACLRSGVGKLTMLTQEENRIILQTSVPEAITCIAERQIALDIACCQAFGIGPGIGTNNTIIKKTASYLKQTKELNIPIVIDADALHLLAEHPNWMQLLQGHAILTPHPGEMKHLKEGLFKEDFTLPQCASAIAKRFNVTVILKGHPTLICTSENSRNLCTKGNSGMATAGSGDVLTGLLTGLLAQGYPIPQAALLGVWLHARAGDYAATKWEKECMLARDIIHHLPQAFAELRQNNL